MSNEGMSAGQLLKQANQLKRAGKLDEAIALYHQVIEINPNFSWAYNNLGDALVKQGNIDDAVTFYSQSLKNNSNSAWLYYCLGEALAKQGDLEAAVKYLQKAIDTKPNFYKFYHSLGQVLTEKGDFDEAIATYDRALKVNPEKTYLYRDLGYALFKKQWSYSFSRNRNLSKRYLFIAGTPRSGTTITTLLLGNHEKIALGMERYKYVYGKSNTVMKHDRFKKERFFDFKSSETNFLIDGQYSDYYKNVLTKWEKADFVGDKYPPLIKHLNSVDPNFYGSYILLIMIRGIYDVASSWNVRADNPDDTYWPEKNNYKPAVHYWNDYLRRTYSLLQKRDSFVFIIEYERLFDPNHPKHKGYLDTILAVLNLTMTDSIKSFYAVKVEEYLEKVKTKPKNVKNGQNNYIDYNADWNLYRKLITEYTL